MTGNEQLFSFIDKFLDSQTQINNYKFDSYIFTDSNIDILQFENHEQTNEFINLCLANGFISLIPKLHKLLLHVSIKSIQMQLM